MRSGLRIPAYIFIQFPRRGRNYGAMNRLRAFTQLARCQPLTLNMIAALQVL